jgi:hypothetical protein
MPIVEPPQPDAALFTRDLLGSVTLFATKAGWLDQGGRAGESTVQVLPRPVTTLRGGAQEACHRGRRGQVSRRPTQRSGQCGQGVRLPQ